MRRRRSFTRWLAPLSILVVAVVIYGIVNSAGEVGGGTESSSRPAATTTTEKRKTKKKTFVVRSGDTLSAISIETGVPVSRLQALNPDLDVQALQPGQKLKLR